MEMDFSFNSATLLVFHHKSQEPGLQPMPTSLTVLCNDEDEDEDESLLRHFYALRHAAVALQSAAEKAHFSCCCCGTIMLLVIAIAIECC